MITTKQAPVIDNDPILCDFELLFKVVYYPRGFPVEISTNSQAVLRAAEQSWAACRQAFFAEPVQISIGVTGLGVNQVGPGESTAPPVVRGRGNLLSMISDAQNFAVCDLSRGSAFAWVTETLATNTAFFRYHFLESTALSILGARYLAPIHAACVALEGKGILLCGDSGAGKSTLSFACARAGWTFISDDASAVVRRRNDRTVVGNPSQMRFRQSAIELFPELARESLTRKMNGEWAIELATSSLQDIHTAPHAAIHHVVFLRREPSGPARLSRFSEADATAWCEGVLSYGELSVREEQRAALRNVLAAGVFELHYSDLDAAVAQLESLARNGG